MFGVLADGSGKPDTGVDINMTQYFSDRELGETPRTIYGISLTVWQGLAMLVQARVENNSFAERFPERCQDYPFDSAVCCGTLVGRFETALKTEIPALAEMEQNWRDAEGEGPYGGFQVSRKQIWQMSLMEQPPLPVIMDIIEFCWRVVSKPEIRGPHSFYHHHHLGFDQEAGRADLREEVNHIFQRNGVAFILTEGGRIERLIPEPTGGVLRGCAFRSGDSELDQLLDAARRKFVMPEENEHRDALEKLWDAWERIKTVDDLDKRTGATMMLDRLARPTQSQFRGLLDSEARALNSAGNSLRIRHSETTQERLEMTEQVDYLFQRMFALIHLFLSVTGRLGSQANDANRATKSPQDEDGFPF